MAKKTRKSGVTNFEQAVEKAVKEKYLLRLYVAGITPRSRRAIENVKRLCADHLAGRCELEIVDIYQQPKLAAGEQILAVPTLIKRLPHPLRRMIGDLSDEEKFLVGIDLKSEIS
ncbi:MAG: circadian clock KaiB family protein [Syntrophales bacterium]|nr:circadian clock KaiB family protein [Syntrophales bacterium]HPL64354.1 circadian clock KaiB family protein [Syntrophales bacterium]